MTIALYIDDVRHEAEAGENLATVLLRYAPHIARRHPVDGSPRAPYCMMGICFECLVEIDGMPDQQACLVTVHEGMKVNRGLR